MKKTSGRKPLRTLILLISAGIFLIMLTVMTLQGFLMYLYWRILYQADIRMPQFWRPIPLLAVLSAIVGVGLTLLFSRIPLKPIRSLIDAINQLAEGNFHVRVYLDLTPEFVRLSESFNRMAQELENTELLRSDFINNFSHEFKTPIVSLRGFAKLLKNEKLSPEERNEYLDIIISESNRLSQLSSNVLNLSKIEKTSILTDMENFDLTEEIRHSILLLDSKWQAKEVELIIDMEELNCYGNKGLLNQVWINLIDNAVKFSPKHGKIKIKLHCKDAQIRSTGSGKIRTDAVISGDISPGAARLEAAATEAVKPGAANSGAIDTNKKTAIFQIMDNGCGMSEETQKHIFDRFYQGDSSHTAEGNGIGLTVADKIIRLHKGTISITSEEGIGTTFTVTLPGITGPAA